MATSCHNPDCIYAVKSKMVDITSFPTYVKCNFCNEIDYCSDSCRIRNWEAHKLNCSVFSKQSSPAQTKKIVELTDFEFVLNATRDKHIILGKGAYGEVKLIKEKATNKLFALKSINKSLLKSSSSARNVNREIKCQKKLNHPNILKLYHALEDNDKIYLVLELAEKGSLFKLLKKNKRLSEKDGFYFFYKTTLAINYMHKNNMIHRDIKPENILINRKFKPKLSDFGFSTEIRNHRSSLCGTMDYLCPEILKKEAYDQKVDIWCLGVLLYEICVGSTPYYAKDPKEKLKNILQNNVKFPKDCSEDFKDLVLLILKENPKYRPEISEILEHKWMKKFYPVYNIDINNLDISNSLINDGKRTSMFKEEPNESLVLRDSYMSFDYLQKNGLENLIEMKQQPSLALIKPPILERDTKGQQNSNVFWKNNSLFLKKSKTDQLKFDKFEALTNSIPLNANPSTFMDTKQKLNLEIKNPITGCEEKVNNENHAFLEMEELNSPTQEMPKREETIKILPVHMRIESNPPKFGQDQDHSTSNVFPQNNNQPPEEEKSPTKRTSLEFTENRDDIMKRFQNNFINIYEGKPLETLSSHPPYSSYSPTFSPNKKLDIGDEFLPPNSERTHLQNKKEADPRNTKNDKIKKILSEIERKKMRRMELEGPRNPYVMERNCLNSKIIQKNEKDLNIWEKLLITFGCIINKKEVIKKR